MIPILWIYALLFGIPALAEESRLDQGLQVYQELSLMAADDVAAARKKAFALISQPAAATPDVWIQAFLFQWDLEKAELTREQQTAEFLQKLMTLARTHSLNPLLLRLEYAAADLQPSDANDEIFVQKAEAAQAYRLAAQILSKQAQASYYSGDMKRCLSLIQRAFGLLEGRVPRDDRQFLAVKTSMAIYLEYSGETRKAEDIYGEVIATHRRLEQRWVLADNLASVALLYMHQKRRNSSARSHEMG